MLRASKRARERALRALLPARELACELPFVGRVLSTCLSTPPGEVQKEVSVVFFLRAGRKFRGFRGGKKRAAESFSGFPVSIKKERDTGFPTLERGPRARAPG